MKRCLKLSRNCRYCAPDERAAPWFTFRQYHPRVYGYNKSPGV